MPPVFSFGGDVGIRKVMLEKIINIVVFLIRLTCILLNIAFWAAFIFLAVCGWILTLGSDDKNAF
jgi:hypothetical protein